MAGRDEGLEYDGVGVHLFYNNENVLNLPLVMDAHIIKILLIKATEYLKLVNRMEYKL